MHVHVRRRGGRRTWHPRRQLPVVGVAFKNAMKQEDDETEAMCWGCVLNGTTKVLKIQS